ncbi:MAG: YtxH domain-containing protein [Candidatus Acidiferrales bacterium]
MAKDNKPGTVLAFLVGMGIGVAAALLLAPKAGEEMRDDISNVIGDSVDQLRERAKDLNRRSQKFVETAKDHLEEAVNEGTDAFKQAKKAGA